MAALSNVQSNNFVERLFINRPLRTIYAVVIKNNLVLSTKNKINVNELNS